jgi:hypothetical protein
MLTRWAQRPRLALDWRLDVTVRANEEHADAKGPQRVRGLGDERPVGPVSGEGKRDLSTRMGLALQHDTEHCVGVPLTRLARHSCGPWLASSRVWAARGRRRRETFDLDKKFTVVPPGEQANARIGAAAFHRRGDLPALTLEVTSECDQDVSLPEPVLAHVGQLRAWAWTMLLSFPICEDARAGRRAPVACLGDGTCDFG